MTKQSALKSLDTVIGKLMHLQYHIDGSTSLQEAIREVAYVRDKLLSGHNTMKSFGKKKTKKSL
jgi:hypothetical protein